MNQNTPALHIDGIIIPVNPHPEHEYTLTTAEVAAGYGVSESTIKEHKRQHADEILAGKHFLEVRNPDFQPGKGGAHSYIHWTKRGIIRLGFFIKSERAKRFRDMAEDLVLREVTTPPALDTAALIPAIATLADAIRLQTIEIGRIHDRLTALEQAHHTPPRFLTPIEDSRRINSFPNPSDEEIASDMLRFVAHLHDLVSREHSNPAEVSFTAREILTRAAKLQCFRRILRGRFLADGTFQATPAARSSVGNLLSRRFANVGFILDDGKPVFLRHSGRGRARRYYVAPGN